MLVDDAEETKLYYYSHLVPLLDCHPRHLGGAAISAPHTLNCMSSLTLLWRTTKEQSIMVNDKIIQKFISDLGTITCSEAEAFNNFHSFGVEPQEYLQTHHSLPYIIYVNEKIWVDQGCHK